MLTKEMTDILVGSKKIGWVLEPEAKRLFSYLGLKVPRFRWARSSEEGIQFAESIGYPVVGKVVSPKVLHKSEAKGVLVGIDTPEALKRAFDRLSKIEGFAGMLVEEMVSGMELIIGAKIDFQFGPVILLGLGGTAVEIYHDVSLRMAPLSTHDVESMVTCLKGHRLLEGYRGAEPINLDELKKLLGTFSELVMSLEREIESIDLNPVICSSSRCVVADARIILRSS
jgi:succinyl-CoA synthetase beta subunit